MARKLISVLLMLGFWAGSTFSAVNNIKIAGDATVVGVSYYGYDLGAGSDKESDASGLASIIRLRTDADLTENVMATVRLINERVWDSIIESGDKTVAIDLDLANVTLRNFYQYPLTLVIGRQEVFVGSGLLVADRDTNRVAITSAFSGGLGDLGARKSFDALVGVVNLSPLIITVGHIKGIEGTLTANDDIDVSGAVFTYDFGHQTVGELTYLIENAKKLDIHAVDARLVYSPLDNLNTNIEAAYQAGKGEGIRADGKHRTDWAFLTGAAYSFLNTEWAPTIGIDYTNISRNWAPLFEAITPASIANNIFTNANYQAIGANFSAKPREDVLVKIRYANLRLAKKVNSSSDAPFTTTWAAYSIDTAKKDLGNEVDLSMIYDYTEDVKLGLDMGVFAPGNVFNDTNDEKAFQTVGSLKVVF